MTIAITWYNAVYVFKASLIIDCIGDLGCVLCDIGGLHDAEPVLGRTLWEVVLEGG
jgi:hypothetical protein